MNAYEKTSSELQFSNEDIHWQIRRIFDSKVFVQSDILRRFLSFIVEETLQGHSDWLKEYTIAVKVLHKPADFKPQENCIVRIHAGRLRRALNWYYNEKGSIDPLRISIPKGGYVPVFQESNKAIADLQNSDDKITGKSVVVAVIPFSHIQSNSFEHSLANGLGLQLSTALMHTRYFSVIAYYKMRNLCEKTTDIRTIAQSVHARYIVTGDIQSVENRLRLHIQMIHTPTDKQVWSRMYERRFTAANIFDIQDEIVKLIVPELEKAWKPRKGELQSVSMIAVA